MRNFRSFGFLVRIRIRAFVFTFLSLCLSINAAPGGPPLDGICSSSDGICDNICNWPQTGFDDGDCLPISISISSPSGGSSDESESVLYTYILEEDYPDCLPALIDKYGSDAPLPYHNNWGRTTNQLGNQQCDSGPFDIEPCGYEFGECVQFHNDYPNCDSMGAALSMGDGQCNEEYNTRACHRDGGDCRLWTVGKQFLVRIGVLALVVFSVMVFIYMKNKKSKRGSTSSASNADAASSQNDPDVQTEQENFQMVEDRRKFILARIIQKKVCSNPHTTNNSDCIDEENSADDRDRTLRAYTNQPKGDIYVEHSFSNRDKRISIAPTSSSASTTVHMDVPRKVERRDGGVIAGDRFTRRPYTNTNTSLSSSPRSSSRTSTFTLTCSICVENYRDGDDIAWSHNDECPHSFHRECIVQWLIHHDECPMCRSPYLAST